MHDRDFAGTLQLLESAGAAHRDRVAKLRELMVPYAAKRYTVSNFIDQHQP